MIDKHRFEVWLHTQHPLKHTLTDFAYTNPGLPGVSDVNGALNWVFKVLYPRTQASVANPAALPLIGNTLNDYRVVLDDGDGKQAGYRWEQREGDVSASWYKIYDFDWSTDSILAAFMDVTQDLYVYQKGKSDLNADGTVRTGVYAGQLVFGGNQANQNLTLAANSGDGTGAHTGYVQLEDTLRPTSTGAYDLGTAANRFGALHLAVGAFINTTTIVGGSISDSGGTITFTSNDVNSTGDLTFTNIFATASVEVGSGTNLILVPGSITDASGAIDFGDEDLSTTGTFASGIATIDSTLVLASGSITDTSGTISFGNEDLSTTGTLSAGNSTFTRTDTDNIRIDGNTVSVLNSNGNLILQANGSGVVDVQNPMTTLGQTVTGTLAVTGQLNADNLRLDGNVLSSTNLNGNITLTPNGSGIVETSASFLPAADGTLDLGAAALRFKDLFMSGDIGDGTTAISSSTIQSLRDINVGVGAGFSLFYDGTKWVSSLPDTEIDHGSLTGLGDDDHLQYALLLGRSGGQVLIGGTAASNTLVFESTSNATKGTIQFKDNFVPFTNASFSGGWQGTDLGDSSHFIRDIYTKGELRGFRFENFTSGTLPSASANNVGHSVWATDNNKIYVDTGGSWIVAGVSKFISDTVWDGVITTLTVTTSSTISDARNAIWQLCDNTNNFERIYTKLEAISATQVRITVSPALPAGSYRLIGVE